MLCKLCNNYRPLIYFEVLFSLIDQNNETLLKRSLRFDLFGEIVILCALQITFIDPPNWKTSNTTPGALFSMISNSWLILNAITIIVVGCFVAGDKYLIQSDRQRKRRQVSNSK